MILGVDLGNYKTKTSREVIFLSKCARVANILNSTAITTDQGTFYIGDGSFDTEYRKVKKEYTKVLFLYAVAMSSSDPSNKVVAGLPLSQYKQDKDEFRGILSNRINDITINGAGRRIIIDDVAVYPEGVGAIIGTDFEGIVIDIGGRTTDVCQVTDSDGIKKVHNPHSLPKGTMNLYSDFVKVINARHGLDLLPDDTERILKNGLHIDGHPVDCAYANDVFRQYVDDLMGSLQVEYSLRTQDVMLVGGGAQLLFKPLSKRIPNARMMDNSIFANAKGFERVGVKLWR
jgi:plasmid segregation protein ParM